MLPLLRSLRLGPSLPLALTVLLALSFAAPAQETVAGAATELPASTYYRVTRPDLRSCPSPFCGGVFVERVGRRLTRCADGTRQPECYVGFVDWSALGLGEEREVRLDQAFAERRVLARGSLAIARTWFGAEAETLFVEDAWRGVTGNEPEGLFWGVTETGIVCVNVPCPIYLEKRLNRNRARLLEGLDLAASGATPEQVERGFAALAEDGLLVAGKHRWIRGPAGYGRELVASEFYTRVGADALRFCGGYTFPPNPPCERGFFCDALPGTCRIVDLPGVCTPLPLGCPRIFDPVCGCDGVTYPNDCERQLARAGLDHAAACKGGGGCDGPVCALEPAR